ncbi:unnamed protein product [Prorocentrum cordatum]|uniref:Uncharacterized protein n=1 Tax=Prorocentrum cordatum TaxID=2364126 RepID=A0ABN9VVW7_9DINO|nr:unnamed protein product [Polarella glacialis]
MHRRRRRGENRAPHRAASPRHRRGGAILRPHLLGPHLGALEYVADAALPLASSQTCNRARARGQLGAPLAWPPARPPRADSAAPPRRRHASSRGGGGGRPPSQARDAGARPQATAPKTEPPEERGRAREARRGGKEEEEGRREGEEGPRPLGHSKENGQQPAYRGGQAEKCPLASPVGLAAPAPSSLCCAAAEVGERNMDRKESEREREGRRLRPRPRGAGTGRLRSKWGRARRTRPG